MAQPPELNQMEQRQTKSSIKVLGRETGGPTWSLDWIDSGSIRG